MRHGTCSAVAASNFRRAVDKILDFEGGYVDHPSDPGGETNFGISKRAYPEEDIRNMTRARAIQIYRRDYWDVVRGDMLPSGVDLVAFDAAVNSGVSRSSKWLQRALGVLQDGRIGPRTIEAARKANNVNTINLALRYREGFLRRLSTWDVFGRGWQRRVDAVRNMALEMAEQEPWWAKYSRWFRWRS